MDQAFSRTLPASPTQSWLDRFGPLPLVFVLCSVLTQRHWGQAASWAYLASGGLVGVFWIAQLAGRSWAAVHARQAVDGAVLILLGSTLAFHALGNAVAGATLAETLLFWAPLICLWWGTSLPNRTWLSVCYFVILHSLPLYAAGQTPDTAFFEQVLLGAITLFVSRQLALDRSLNERVLRDRLTGLISPECFETELAMIAAVADRYRVSFSLIACAPDKPIENSQQPGAADSEQSLQAMADLIVEHIRQSDTVCRWEGNIFFILLPNTSSQDAARIAQNLLTDFPTLTHVAHTCSLGIATHRFGEDPMLTFNTAEKALSASLSAGGNRATMAGTAY